MLFVIFKTNLNASIPLKTFPEGLKSEIYVQGYMVKEMLTNYRSTFLNSCL